MAFQINKKLLPLKVHYFLKYGGMSFFPFLPALIRQEGGVSEGGVGLIWTVIPLTSAATNMLVGTIADYYKIHRSFFMAGMVTLTVTFLAVFFMPAVPKPTSEPVMATLSLQCLHDSARFVVCPNANNASHGWTTGTFNECGFNDNSNSTILGDQMDVTYDLQCKMFSGGQNAAVESAHFPTEFSLTLDGHQSAYNVCSSKNCTVITEVNATSTFSELYNVSCHESYETMCQYSCETSVVEESQVTLGYLLHSVNFWMIFINMLILYAGNGVTTTMADTVCFFLLGKDRHKYGHQRLWGSLAWGLAGVTNGALVNYFSPDKSNMNYIPVVVVAFAFLFLNLIVSSTIKFDVPKKEVLKASIVGNTLCSFKMIVFLVTVMVGGITMGTQWTFFFIVVEDVAIAWDPNFAYIKVIQGFLVGIECFFGEVPFLFLSSYVIKRLGNVRTFSGVLIILSLRCFLYSFVTNPWYFLPIEFLHGPSFGLLYPNMITYANALAPKGAQATIQGIVKSTFVGGVSLGGLIGGILMEKVRGSKTYLFLGVFDLVFTILFIVANFARDRIKSQTHSRNDDQENECEPMGNGDHVMGDDEDFPLACDLPTPSITQISNGPQSINKPPLYTKVPLDE